MIILLVHDHSTQRNAVLELNKKRETEMKMAKASLNITNVRN